ncbi:MAG: hypothetical protein WCH98_22925, partial [Verrucomicrobiota bacterium]
PPHPMNNFYLSHVPEMEARFKTLSLSEFRLLVNSAVAEMKSVFDDYYDPIEDWANGGWSGRSKMMRDYGNIMDYSLCKIELIKHFDRLIEAFQDRERAVLKASLERKYSLPISQPEFGQLATF